MPVSITKTKKKPVTKAKPKVQSNLSATVDMAGAMDKEIKDLKELLAPLEKDFKGAKATIDSYMDDTMHFPGEAGTTFEGEQYYLEVGKKADKSTIKDAESVFDALEELQTGLAFQLMKFNVSDLKKYLPGTLVDELMDTDAIGPRKFKFHAKV